MGGTGEIPPRTPEPDQKVGGSAMEVTGAVGRPANVGLVTREREGGDRSTMATTSIGSDPRTFSQSIDIFLSG